MRSRTRSSPVGTIAIWGAIVMLAFQGGISFLGDIAADTWKHIDSAIPSQADADSYACRVADTMRNEDGEWLLTPDNPEALDCD